MAANVFQHQHRVTYADCTLGNHVYYGQYLSLLEAARGAFFRKLGLSFLALQEQAVIFPVIECHLRYKSPARYDDELNIAVWPYELERVRLNLAYRITSSGNRIILEGETLHVCTNLQDKLIRLPADMVEKLTPWLSPASDLPRTVTS